MTIPNFFTIIFKKKCKIVQFSAKKRPNTVVKGLDITITSLILKYMNKSLIEI